MKHLKKIKKIGFCIEIMLLLMSLCGDAYGAVSSEPGYEGLLFPIAILLIVVALCIKFESNKVLLVMGLGMGFFAHMHRPEAILLGGVTWVLKAEVYYGLLFMATLIVITAGMKLAKGNTK